MRSDIAGCAIASGSPVVNISDSHVPIYWCVDRAPQRQKHGRYNDSNQSSPSKTTKKPPAHAHTHITGVPQRKAQVLEMNRV